MWCYTIGLPGFTLAANPNHLKKNNFHVGWSTKSMFQCYLLCLIKLLSIGLLEHSGAVISLVTCIHLHWYHSSLLGVETVFFLNYRGRVCFLGITTQNQGCCTYHSSKSARWSPPSTVAHVSSRSYGAKFRWRFGGRNIGETWDTHGF